MSGLRVASLFCGIGGLDLMLEKAGHTVVWASDKDKYACMTYRHNFPHVPLVEGDIREIDKASIPDFDILAAGFPCQPFSVCGKQKGFSDPRGNVFFEIGKTIDAKHPSVVFLENVANLTEHDGGRTFNVIHKELAGRNYFLRYLVADACEYANIPQHRTRTYLVAFRDEEQCRRFTFPDKKPLTRRITDVIDTTQKADESFYLHPGDYGYDKMVSAIRDGTIRWSPLFVTISSSTAFPITAYNRAKTASPLRSKPIWERTRTAFPSSKTSSAFAA